MMSPEGMGGMVGRGRGRREREREGERDRERGGVTTDSNT
jgi:hypothetical protein